MSEAYASYSAVILEEMPTDSKYKKQNKEDFYFEYIDTQSKNNNNEEDVTLSVHKYIQVS